MLMLNRASTAAAAELPQIVQGFDLRQALNFAWRQWKLIVAVLTAAILIGAAYLAVQVRLYTATTLILRTGRFKPVSIQNEQHFVLFCGLKYFFLKTAQAGTRFPVNVPGRLRTLIIPGTENIYGVHHR